MGCSCATRDKGVETQEDEPALVKLSLRKPAAHFAQLKALEKPLTVLYRTVASTHSNMALVECQASQQLCFLRSYPKPGLLIVEKVRAQAAADTELLSNLDHPHVVKWLEVLENQRHFYVVTEALLGGELLDFLSNRVSITESLACRVLSQVLLGLSYAHSQGVPHLSLHPSLLLFKSAPKDDVLQLKIAGFEDARTFRAHREVGVYCAPEVYEGRAGAKSDVWSCGMLLYRMLAGETALSTADYTSMLSTTVAWEPAFPERCWSTRSADVKALVSSMLAWNSSARPEVADCLKHVWFDSNRPQFSSKGARASLVRLLAVQDKRPLRDALKTALLHRTPSELPLLMGTFTALDQDWDGLLGVNDLTEGLKALLPPDQLDTEVSRLLCILDKGRRGGIAYSEFLIAASSEKRLLAQESLLRAFTSLDRERRGKVRVEALQHLFEWSAERGKLWGELARQARREASEDLDFHEFARVLTQAVS